jgi:LPXTG-motif cell wall-anchored protein
LGTTVGCAQCEDDFEVKDLKCVEKSSNTWVFVLIGLGVLTILVVIGVCYLKKKRAKKQ